MINILDLIELIPEFFSKHAREKLILFFCITILFVAYCYPQQYKKGVSTVLNFVSQEKIKDIQPMIDGYIKIFKK